jgi:nucleotide-binding universal stress UspA family protein
MSARPSGRFSIAPRPSAAVDLHQSANGGRPPLLVDDLGRGRSEGSNTRTGRIFRRFLMIKSHTVVRVNSSQGRSPSQPVAREQTRLAFMDHLIVATDGSQLAGKAVAEGIQLASTLGARITFVTVIAPLASVGDQDTAFPGLPESVRQQALEYLTADADRALSEALSVAKLAGVTADTARIEGRHPHEAIIAAAKSKGARLILLASHGRSGVKAILLGSVTQKVLAHSDVPVLVCR